jgi:hypothetical protein
MKIAFQNLEGIVPLSSGQQCSNGIVEKSGVKLIPFPL